MPVPWDSTQPYRGLGFREVEAELQKIVMRLQNFLYRKDNVMKNNKQELIDVKMPVDNARRELLKRGLQLTLMSIPVVIALNSRKVLAGEEGDVTKIKFHYQDHPNGSMRCVQCVYFVPPAPSRLTGVCRIIDGDVIANGWCTAFRPA